MKRRNKSKRTRKYLNSARHIKAHRMDAVWTQYKAKKYHLRWYTLAYEGSGNQFNRPALFNGHQRWFRGTQYEDIIYHYYPDYPVTDYGDDRVRIHEKQPQRMYDAHNFFHNEGYHRQQFKWRNGGDAFERRRLVPSPPMPIPVPAPPMHIPVPAPPMPIPVPAPAARRIPSIQPIPARGPIPAPALLGPFPLPAARHPHHVPAVPYPHYVPVARRPLIADEEQPRESSSRVEKRIRAPTSEFRIVSGGVDWIESEIFDIDVLLVLAEFVPEIGFAGFEERKVIFGGPYKATLGMLKTFQISPISLLDRRPDTIEATPESGWKFSKNKNAFNSRWLYGPISWSCIVGDVIRDNAVLRDLHAEGLRINDPATEPKKLAETLATVSLHGLQTLFQVSLLSNGDLLNWMHIDWEDEYTPPPFEESEKQTMQMYAGVNKNMKVFVCTEFYTNEVVSENCLHYRHTPVIVTEIFLYDLIDFIDYLFETKDLLNLRKEENLVYFAANPGEDGRW